ncbi:ABC transporter permease [Pseudooceanicola nanhaiensis]|uniref:ABC transporter permease n=1 Tax=Pseudooceanicola nanhaiensis TaxID=375761 RepID=UPI001CD5C167|nr:ABC transporter permease [Pseudooceanicola nanhaiensis]MCA0920828.1 ABC transporter permease [Pseudooceanicola nanhaiensis]
MSDLTTTAPRRKDTPLRRLARQFLEDRIAVAALAVFLAVALFTLLGPFIVPQNPYDLAQLDFMDGGLPPGSQSFSGMTYWLGTDTQGRDMLSAIAYGLRISLAVSFTSLILALIIGVAAGLAAAYFGGRIDTLIMRVVDIQLSFPSILIALILLALFGRGIDKVILAIVIVQWADFARTVRSSAIVERRKEYIEAAHCLGLSRQRTMFRHLLPNSLPPLIVLATVKIASAISLEATLSFLGAGVPITQPSLGLLIANGYDFLLSGRYWIAIFPGVALLITIVAINLVGDRLRDVLNPRLQK